MSLDPDFNASCEHLANIIRSAEEARTAEAQTRAVLSHCAVELIMARSKRFLVGKKREEERARLFALWDAGRINLSIGGGTVAVEMEETDLFPASC